MIPTCPECSQKYNTTDHVPHVVTCGHSICSKCLSEIETTGICSACEKEFVPENCPVNYSLKEQISNDEPTVVKPGDGIIWHCSVCTFRIHPKQARICVKCLPKDIAENTLKGLVIHNVEKAELNLICAHCSIESQHSYHITVLYLKAKMEKFAEEKGENLINMIVKGSITRTEAATLKKTIETLKVDTLDAASWYGFEQTWMDTEMAVHALVTSNKNINSYHASINTLMKQIEEENNKKQELFGRLTCIVGGFRTDSPSNSPVVRRRPGSGSEADTDSLSSLSLRRYGIVEDLTSLADANAVEK